MQVISSEEHETPRTARDANLVSGVLASGRSRRFSLRSLFVGVLIMALVSALTASHGINGLILLLGLYLCILNFFGVFAPLQRRNRIRCVCCCVYPLFLLSFFLPASRSVFVDGPDSYGWDCALLFLRCIARFPEYHHWNPFAVIDVLIFVAAVAGNVALLPYPFVFDRLGNLRVLVYGDVLLVAALCTWTIPLMFNVRLLLIGYALWCIAFTVTTITIPISRRRLVGVVVLSIVVLLRFHRDILALE